MTVLASAGPTVSVDQLSDADNATANRLLTQIQRYSARNIRRTAAYEQSVGARLLRSTTREELAHLRAVLGWSTKAVDALANLIIFEGLTLPGGELDTFGLGAYLAENRLVDEAELAQVNALVHGCAFLVTTVGQPGTLEPPVLTVSTTALNSTGTWNRRTRRFEDFLTVTATNADRSIRAFTLYLPGRVISCAQGPAGGRRGWEIEEAPVPLAFVPVEPIVFRPRDDRRLGTSRITPAALYCQEAAVRTVARSELGAEAYIDPVRAFLGADPMQFLNADGTPNLAAQQAASGRVVVVPPNWTGPGGEVIGPDDKPIVPTLATIPGATMTPHRDQLEMFASLFAAETDIPMSEMGLRSGSVPVSAQALQASRNALNLYAENAARAAGGAYVRAAQTAYMLAERLRAPAELPAELRALTASYRDPSRPSRGEAGDFVQKLVASQILPAESPVVLEAAGFDQNDIARIEADRRRAGAMSALQGLIGRA